MTRVYVRQLNVRNAFKRGVLMEFYTVNIKGNDIQVADYPGEKGTIIAIHGLTGTHKNMHYYAEKFRDLTDL